MSIVVKMAKVVVHIILEFSMLLLSKCVVSPEIMWWVVEVMG